MNLKRNLILIAAIINETTKPKPKLRKSELEKESADFTRSNPVAAAIVGMASRKENSTVVWRFILTIIPPIIVAAALEIPGIIEID